MLVPRAFGREISEPCGALRASFRLEDYKYGGHSQYLAVESDGETLEDGRDDVGSAFFGRIPAMGSSPGAWASVRFLAMLDRMHPQRASGLPATSFGQVLSAPRCVPTNGVQWRLTRQCLAVFDEWARKWQRWACPVQCDFLVQANLCDGAYAQVHGLQRDQQERA